MVLEATAIDTQVTEDPLDVTGALLGEEHLQDTEAGEAGAAVLVSPGVQSATVAVVIVAAGAPFAVVLLWRGTVGHHVLKGEGHLHGAGVGANLDRIRLVNHNPQSVQTKVTQGHHLVLPLGRQAWFHMEMGHLILAGIKIYGCDGCRDSVVGSDLLLCDSEYFVRVC